MIELSFVIPAYNVEKYIERCLNSIYSQDIDESLYEVIVVDDGSTDGTLRVLKELQSKYHSLEVVSQMNQGPGAARNVGIERSQGRFIWFVDADDYISEDAVACLLKRLKDEQLDFICFNTKVIDIGGKEITNKFPEKLTGTTITGVEAIKQGFLIGSVWLIVWRKSFLERIGVRFLPNVFRGEDSLFCFTAELQAEKILIVDDYFYIYEKREGTLTTKATHESIRREKLGDVTIASNLKLLAEQLRSYDHVKSDLAYIHEKQIEFGLLLSLLKNNKEWSKWGINYEVIKEMKKMRIFPLHGPYCSWKQWLICQFLNIVFLIR